MTKEFFAIGTYGAKYPENTGTLWRTAQGFGASYIFTIGERYMHRPSDTRKAFQEIPLMQYPNFKSFKESFPKGVVLVGVELNKQRSINLNNFRHPLRAIYLLGSEKGGLPLDIQRQCDYIIQVPYSKQCLNVSLTGGIVMYDRINKIKNNQFSDNQSSRINKARI